MREIAVTAMGADRPGIVAALTGGLVAVGGNLDDVRASILGGSFAIVLLVRVPDDVTAGDVRAALQPDADRLGMGLWVGDAPPPAMPGEDVERCVVSVYGIDHPGIVHAVARDLAAHGVNIRDLSSRAVGTPPIYTLAVEVDLPPALSAEALRVALAPTAERSRVELAVTPWDEDLL
ncbi:MAG: ACT domain-containing protein [Thermoleophilia bacterium]|nr:ACT domain-containing protein [Thermoleophilia bacterium]